MGLKTLNQTEFMELSCLSFRCRGLICFINNSIKTNKKHASKI